MELMTPVISQDDRRNYLRRRRDELTRCFAALKAEDWEVLRRTAHKVKGNAETFGFSDLTPIAVAIEKAAEEREAEKASASLYLLQKELETLTETS